MLESIKNVILKKKKNWFAVRYCSETYVECVGVHLVVVKVPSGINFLVFGMLFISAALAFFYHWTQTDNNRWKGHSKVAE